MSLSRTGRSMGSKAWRTPSLVRAPRRALSLVETPASSASWEAGFLDPELSGEGSDIREISPLVVSATKQGASAISNFSAASGARAVGATWSSRIVRRGVPKDSAALASSSETVWRNNSSLPSNSVRWEISATNASRSDSSSMREILVRRRRRNSRM